MTTIRDTDPRADIARLISRSRRIGSRQDLVVHGGGNTSTKSAATDHLGRVRPVLVIKASGADLATLTENGVCTLFLDDLRMLRERGAMSDEEMADALARSMVRPDQARPSIETLLHAFLPQREVDHVHADAICALTKGPDPRAAVREALGPSVPFVEWIRPGFRLAKLIAGHADAGAVVLEHHGLVTWSDAPDGSWERTHELVGRAQRYLAGRTANVPRTPLPPPEAELELIARVRGRLSRGVRRVLHVRRDRTFSDRPDVDRIAEAGPATADHLMHVRPWPAIVRTTNDADRAIAQVEDRYREYFARCAPPPAGPVAMHDPAPTVVIVPGLGTITAGQDARAARVVADVAWHTQQVSAAAIDAFGSTRALAEQDMFDVDYWPLELAKRTVPLRRDLDGRIYIVTGAGGGIGRAIASAITGAGGHVVATDIDAAALERTRDEVAAAGAAPELVVGDITSDDTAEALVAAAVRSFGGLDGVVSNAGIAVTGDIANLSRWEWDRSIAVNATSHFLLVRAAMRILSVQGLGGSIVLIASKNAFSPGRGFGAYSAAKAAEVQLARMTAIEGGRIGVRANVVNPDAIFRGSGLWSDELRASRAAAHGVPAERLEEFYASRNLLGIEVRAEDVAQATLFLLSDRSSRTTGCVITVDGGVEGAFPR